MAILMYPSTDHSDSRRILKENKTVATWNTYVFTSMVRDGRAVGPQQRTLKRIEEIIKSPRDNDVVIESD